ncbi:MAG TPA: carboxy terminal-processing peptidase, partial [Chryseolinea sp.]|nr:carboxy terminal-processing peptidase [Chryseolinea sp.]
LKSVFLTFSISTLAQQPASVQNEALQLKKLILQHHFDPKPVDDVFSAKVFDHVLNALDPEKLYFTQQDIAALSAFKDKIDDDLKGTSWNFLPAITERYKKSLLRSEEIITRHTKAPFDLSKKELFISDTAWAESDAASSALWHKNLKYETLDELIQLQKRTPEIKDSEFLTTKEPDARQRVQRNSLRMIHRILNHASGYENHIATQFLQSVSLAFDPHSSYLSLAQMENFLASLSTEGYYFGISVDENERGEIVITQLTPGGPAWKSGEVHAGDVIEQIRWEGSEWIEVEGMTQDEFDNLLEESIRNSIEFTLKETGGIEKTVRLRKEKMSAEENRVKSFILEGEKRIGYVSLPGFYTDWGDEEGSRCANDVAKEILKLKKEHIDGLVLDVRYNRGGSLKEAVAMAGIFIDAGPMGVLKVKGGTTQSEKDVNRGTVYDGPLLLMVNGLSASASEFLAAALQDYHRGIIVGSRTYGKATGQEVFSLEPVEKHASASAAKKLGWGYTTITTLKIYRVTGKTAQKRGVAPDIMLPDLYDFIEFREENLEDALTSDSISRKIYYTPLGVLPVCELKEKSQVRIAKNNAFQTTIQCSKALGGLATKLDTVSLNWADYKKMIMEEGKQFKSLKEITENPTNAFKVNNHVFDQERMNRDEYIRQVNEVWAKNLVRDISLEEAFFIICDYITGPTTK